MSLFCVKQLPHLENVYLATVISWLELLLTAYFLPSVDYPEDGAKLCLFYINGDNSYRLSQICLFIMAVLTGTFDQKLKGRQIRSVQTTD